MKTLQSKHILIIIVVLLITLVVIGTVLLLVLLSRKPVVAVKGQAEPTSLVTSSLVIVTPSLSVKASPTNSPTIKPSTSTPLPTLTATPLPITTATSTPTIIPTPTAQPSPTPEAIPVAVRVITLPNGRLQAEYPNLGLSLIYEAKSFGQTHLSEFISNYQAALKHVREQLNFTSSFTITYELRTDGAPDPLGLGVRGFTDAQKNRIYQIYDGSGDPKDRCYITAHELTHMVANRKIGNAANVMLSEGYAMYGSDYFTGQAGMVTLHDFAVAALQQNRLVSLVELSKAEDADFNGRLTARLNYDLSGSFVTWLITEYGLAKFEQVYPSGDYPSIYGRTLLQLQDEWLKFLNSRPALSFDSKRYFSYFDRVLTAYKKLYSNAQVSDTRLNQGAYKAVDNARLAFDRHNYDQAEKFLEIFEAILSN